MQFDWPGLMRAGMQGLGLHPEQFWRLTPVELLVMLGIAGGDAPLTRQRLAEMSEAFPDMAKGQADGGCERAERTDRGT